MSIGSILVGIAVALLVAAYLARPFRPTRPGSDFDRAIETWVARARSEALIEQEPPPAAQPETSQTATEPVNFCPQCGRRVGPDDRFCAGCGRRLPGGGA